MRSACPIWAVADRGIPDRITATRREGAIVQLRNLQACLTVLLFSLSLAPCSAQVRAADSVAPAPDPADAEAADTEESLTLEYRLVGPWRGGRVTTVTGVPGKPHLYYMGATG